MSVLTSLMYFFKLGIKWCNHMKLFKEQSEANKPENVRPVLIVNKSVNVDVEAKSSRSNFYEIQSFSYTGVSLIVAGVVVRSMVTVS